MDGINTADLVSLSSGYYMYHGIVIGHPKYSRLIVFIAPSSSLLNVNTMYCNYCGVVHLIIAIMIVITLFLQHQHKQGLLGFHLYIHSSAKSYLVSSTHGKKKFHASQKKSQEGPGDEATSPMPRKPLYACSIIVSQQRGNFRGALYSEFITPFSGFSVQSY